MVQKENSSGIPIWGPFRIISGEHHILLYNLFLNKTPYKQQLLLFQENPVENPQLRGAVVNPQENTKIQVKSSVETARV